MQQKHHHREEQTAQDEYTKQTNNVRRQGELGTRDSINKAVMT